MSDATIVENTENTASQLGVEGTPNKPKEVSISRVFDLADSLPAYSPPKIQQNSRNYEYDGAMDNCINSESAELIDDLILLSRDGNDAYAREFEELVAQAGEKIRHLRLIESQATVGVEDEVVLKAFAQIKRLDAPLEKSEAKLIVDRIAAAELADKEAKARLVNVKKMQEANFYQDLSNQDEESAKGKGGMGHRFKFALSSSYRFEKTQEERDGRLRRSDQLLNDSQKTKDAAEQSFAEAKEGLESLFTGGLNIEQSMANVQILANEYYRLTSVGRGTSDEEISAAKQMHEIYDVLSVFKSLISGNIQIASEDGFYQSLPQEFKRNMSELVSKIEQITKNKDISSNVEEAYLKELSKWLTKEIDQKCYERDSYDVDLFVYKSDELRFVPTTSELKIIKDLMRNGLSFNTFNFLDILVRSRDRFELATRADCSFLSHTTTINRALMIIDSGAIMSPDMVAKGRNEDDPRKYSNSPAGQKRRLEGETYMTLNDFESAYFSPRFDESIRDLPNFIDDQERKLGAIFVANFGEIGKNRDWFLQQNSQEKPDGAEEVVVKIGGEPLGIDNFYIMIKQDPEAVKLYTEHLLKSGKTQEWISQHLIPIKITLGGKSFDYTHVEIRDVLRERKVISTNKKKLFIPKFRGNVASQTHGSTDVASFRLQEINNSVEGVN